MASLLRYLVLLIAPFACLAIAVYNHWLPDKHIILLFALYAFMYQPVLHFFRLREKHLMQNKDFFKVFSPFFSLQHARALLYP